MQQSLFRFVAFVVVGIVLAAFRGLAQTSTSSGVPPYLNPSLPVAARVDDLIARMTLEEKASQLVNQARAIPRLQVPAYDWWSEALHGVAWAGTATVFPEPIGLAATFDAPLIHDMAMAIGTEARAKHNQAVRAGRRDIMEGLDFWSPNINIFRDPRWGRGQETYGEDPFLTSRMGVAFVTGMQGDDPKYFRVIATPKHFAVHSGPEPARHGMNVEVSQHDMQDTYLPAFRAAVTEGKAESIMCAYNRVNGQPACANTFLLQDELREAWKFDGYVVSDCDAIDDIFNGHHYTKSTAEAGALALKAGMDNECADFFSPATGNSDYVKFLDAVQQGLLTEKEIDLTLQRLFTARFRLGLFDPPEMVPYAQTPESEIDSNPHRALALKTARESIVLLKNDGVLPLRSENSIDGKKRIAVSGPLADSTLVLHGNYCGTASHAVSAIEGIRKLFGEAQVTYSAGTNFLRQRILIPTALLSTEDGQPGLKAEYFAGDKFRGTPEVSRVDKMVDLQFFPPDSSAIQPPAGLKDFSVRWTGYLTPAESGDYEIGLDGSSDRMWLDGNLIADDSAPQNSAPKTAAMHLEKGRRYALRIEFVTGGSGTKLVWMKLISNPIAEAVEAAKEADVAVAVVGITSQLEGEEMKVEVPGFKGGDRTSLDLPIPEEELLEALKATGKPLIVVLMNGSALSVNWAKEHADAIVDAWYAGEEGGTAIAQTLAGWNNPAGRLPVTFYKGVDQLPAFENYSMYNRTYRYFTGEPLYPFGYGLSYSTFEYSNLKLSAATLEGGASLGVDIDIQNTSPRPGEEVAELYLTFPKSPSAPIHALRGFQRLHLNSGESRQVHFDLEARDLSTVDAKGKRVVEKGTYQLTVGGGQPGSGAPHASSTFKIKGKKALAE
jgi:beta-glucosidase